MLNFITTTLASVRRLTGSRSSSQTERRVHLSVESLEDRQVPSAGFLRHVPDHVRHHPVHQRGHHKVVFQAPAPALNTSPAANVGNTVQDAGGGLNFGGFDQLLEIRDLMNAERQKVGLGPLTIESHLQAVAWSYASTLARLDLWNGSNHHEDEPNGTDSQAVLDRDVNGGYTGHTFGENISWGQPNAQVAMYGDGSSNPWQGWMHSPPHRANILNPSFTDTGVAGWMSASGHLYWVVEFGGQ
jgi:uncharacterized protein YkwD